MFTNPCPCTTVLSHQRLPSLVTLARSYRDSLPGSLQSISASNSTTFVPNPQSQQTKVSLGHGFGSDSLLTINTGPQAQSTTGAGSVHHINMPGKSNGHCSRKTVNFTCDSPQQVKSRPCSRQSRSGSCADAISEHPPDSCDSVIAASSTGSITTGFGMTVTSRSPSPQHKLHHTFVINNPSEPSAMVSGSSTTIKCHLPT